MSRRVVAVLVLAVCGAAAAPAEATVDGWHVAWARSQAPAPGAPVLVDQTARVIARVTGGGTGVRVRLQNAFGTSPLAGGSLPVTVDAATVALRGRGAAVVASTLRPLTFAGRRSVTIAPGAHVESDPVALSVQAGQDLAVSVHSPGAVSAAHLIDTVTHYVSGPGDATAEVSGAPFITTTRSPPLVAAVDVRGGSLAGAVVAIGGSVVDGVGSTLDGHDAWPDDLAARLVAEAPAGQRKTVVNAGIASTTAARACASVAGPGAQDRLGRDALGLAGVTDLIVYAGTNDLAGPNEHVGGCTGDQIIAAFKDIARQAQARGVRVLISTITPRAAYTAQENGYRRHVNAWVQGGGNCSGGCDEALDFDAVLRDPTRPDRIAPALDSGDHVHPNPEGYRRIAASIDLADLGVRAPAASPRVRVTLRAHRAGGGRRLVATVRTALRGTARIALRRGGRTIRARRVAVRSPVTTIRFDVRRRGRYAVRVSIAGSTASSAGVGVTRR